MIQLTAHFVLEEFILSSTDLSLGIENKPTPEHMPKRCAPCSTGA